MISTAEIESIVERALEEDLPDITSDAIFGPEEEGSARFLVKEAGVLAGLRFAGAVFFSIDGSTRFEPSMRDGEWVESGTVIATVEGNVRTLLSAERTALNLLQRASGIATLTRRFVDAVAGTAAGIYDTRKTAPGLRALDKYAVTAGGGRNHRYALHDLFLIKNNHIDRAGSIAKAVAACRESGRIEKVMVEVRDHAELEQALAAGADFILLDNMSVEGMAAAVRITAGRVPLEASGGITLQSVRAIAETGVDRISVGALTHSLRALDISMRIDRK
ncbi:MAG TPA: carboxylating nicotinate-nucleotide diphosphorylase [Thermoanaerobaculia bacterium]|nr:carboxylating nicotinate-nucleotide diphosphorylase [Thermoanaerobaculia bacterium]